MKTKGLTQEGLKLIACGSMLIDHIGATLVLQLCREQPQMWELYQLLRIIGRIAFPIYCFLLVEGAFHTRSPGKYGLRLAIGALLSELPFDFAFRGGLDWGHQNVMVTLLLGFLMLQAMERTAGLGKLVVILPFFLAAEWLRTDYGGNGIAIIAMLALTRGMEKEELVRLAAFVALLWFGGKIRLGPVLIPMELFGLLAMIPISCYSSRKRTHNAAVQWAFYLFYPVHLLVLYLLGGI